MARGVAQGGVLGPLARLGKGGPVAQIYRCDLCGSLSGRAGLGVWVGQNRDFGREVDEAWPNAQYRDLCLGCAQRIVNVLGAIAKGEKV